MIILVAYIKNYITNNYINIFRYFNIFVILILYII